MFNFEGTLMYLQMYLENWIEESKATERAALLKEEVRHKVKASSKVENFLTLCTDLRTLQVSTSSYLKSP